MTLGIVAHGHLPGLCVPPWTLRATMECLEQRKLGVRDVFILGDLEAGQRMFERASFGHALGRFHPSHPRGDDGIRLKLPESPNDAQVPASWVGTNLVLLAPLCHQRTRNGGWRGPILNAMHHLAGALGYRAPNDPTTHVGARVVSDVFASSTTLLDATWWLAAESDGVQACDPIAPEHVLSVACHELEDLRAVDEWLDALLNLGAVKGAHANAHPSVPLVTGRRRPWPIARLPARRFASEGLAGRAVKALWGRRSLPEPVRAALRPTIPGKFCHAWSSYRPVDLSTPSNP